MIKINLLGDDTAIDYTSRYQLWGFVSSLILLVLIFVFMQFDITSRVDELGETQAQLKDQLDQLKVVTKEVRDLEAKKKDLNEKRSVIARLKLNKVGPVRVMDDLNVSIPEKAWLVGVQENAGIMNINGFALDNQTIALFMKALEKSDYFVRDSIKLIETRNSVKDGVNIKQFSLEVQVNYAGKIPSALIAGPKSNAAAYNLLAETSRADS